MTTSQTAGLKHQFPTALGRLAALSLLSLALGLTFNASNPTGIRFREDSESPAGTETKSAVAKDPSSPYANATVSVFLTAPPQPAALTPKPAPTATPPHSHAIAPTTKFPPAGGTEPLPIAWDEAAKILGGKKAILVDARPTPSFQAGHIPGAVSLPETSQLIDLAAFQNKYGKETVIITYCANTECPVSLKLANRLIREYGYKTVRYMPGGFQEWQRHQATAKPGP